MLSNNSSDKTFLFFPPTQTQKEEINIDMPAIKGTYKGRNPMTSTLHFYYHICKDLKFPIQPSKLPYLIINANSCSEIHWMLYQDFALKKNSDRTQVSWNCTPFQSSVRNVHCRHSNTILILQHVWHPKKNTHKINLIFQSKINWSRKLHSQFLISREIQIFR